MSDLPPVGYIDAPWTYVLESPARAEELSRAAWIDEVRKRLGLVTREQQIADGTWPAAHHKPVSGFPALIIDK